MKSTAWNLFDAQCFTISFVFIPLGEINQQRSFAFEKEKRIDWCCC
jgi:hypothetical protein